LLIVYHSIGFTNQHQNFGGKLTKVGVGVCQFGAQNFNVGFLKPTLYNILHNLVLV